MVSFHEVESINAHYTLYDTPGISSVNVPIVTFSEQYVSFVP
jgi:hypothetical protein